MLYSILAFISGAALTIQVGINGKLLGQMGSPLLTALISFLAGTAGLAVTYLFAAANGMQTMPAMSAFQQTPLWMWLGGLLGAFYIFSAIFCVPQIGFANMFSLVVAGQIILALLFDHFGVLAAGAHEISLLRLLGVGLLILGVYLIQTQ